MTCAHPFLYVHNVCYFMRFLAWIDRSFGVFSRFVVAFKIASEVLEEGYLLLEVLRVLSEIILVSKILPICGAALYVVKVIAVGVEHDLGGIVKEDPSGVIAEVIAETVLRRVVDPLSDPHFSVF